MRLFVFSSGTNICPQTCRIFIFSYTNICFFIFCFPRRWRKMQPQPGSHGNQRGKRQYLEHWYDQTKLQEKALFFLTFIVFEYSIGREKFSIFWLCICCGSHDGMSTIKNLILLIQLFSVPSFALKTIKCSFSPLWTVSTTPLLSLGALFSHLQPWKIHWVNLIS